MATPAGVISSSSNGLHARYVDPGCAAPLPHRPTPCPCVAISKSCDNKRVGDSLVGEGRKGGLAHPPDMARVCVAVTAMRCAGWGQEESSGRDELHNSGRSKIRTRQRTSPPWGQSRLPARPMIGCMAKVSPAARYGSPRRGNGGRSG